MMSRMLLRRRNNISGAYALIGSADNIEKYKMAKTAKRGVSEAMCRRTSTNI